MFEKRNVVEDGRTPMSTEKSAGVVDGAVSKFKRPVDSTAATEKLTRVAPQQEEPTDVGQTVDR